MFLKLGIGILCGGKHYADINELAGSVKLEHWEQYKKGEGEKARVWSYYEFGDRRGTWEIDEFLRAFYCTQETEENGQYLMEFVKHDSIIYTNIGMGGKIDEQLINAGHGDMLKAGMIIETYFGRGSDELVNRAFKNFVSQKLPFKRFNMNATYYYLSMTAFLLLEASDSKLLTKSAPSVSTKHLSMMSVMTSFQYHPTLPLYAGNYSTMLGK